MGKLEKAKILLGLLRHHTIGVGALYGAWLSAASCTHNWFVICRNHVSIGIEVRFVLTVNHGTLEVAFLMGASRREKPGPDLLFLRDVGVVVNGSHESKKGLSVDGHGPDI